jgi:hypothetical protein
MELTGFLSVDEAKLNALEPSQAGELHRQGALSLAYLPLLSLRRFRPLMERAAAQEPEALAAAEARAAQARAAAIPLNNA